MKQLTLFDWASGAYTLNDLGGKCAWCLQTDHWLTTDEWSDLLNTRYYHLECQTPVFQDNGDYVGPCKCEKLVSEDE